MTAEVNHMDKGGKCKRNWRIFPIVTYVQYLLDQDKTFSKYSHLCNSYRENLLCIKT